SPATCRRRAALPGGQRDSFQALLPSPRPECCVSDRGCTLIDEGCEEVNVTPFRVYDCCEYGFTVGFVQRVQPSVHYRLRGLGCWRCRQTVCERHDESPSRSVFVV